VLYFVTKLSGGSVSPEELEARSSSGPVHRVVVLANRTMAESELHDALKDLPGSEQAEYLVVVPANPVDTGQADREGAAFVWQATDEAARQRLDQTLHDLGSLGLTVRGEVGDYRPPVALDKAMREFEPDHVVIATQPEDRSAWLRDRVVANARAKYDVPVQHVVVQATVPQR